MRPNFCFQNSQLNSHSGWRDMRARIKTNLHHNVRNWFMKEEAGMMGSGAQVVPVIQRSFDSLGWMDISIRIQRISGAPGSKSQPPLERGETCLRQTPERLSYPHAFCLSKDEPSSCPEVNQIKHVSHVHIVSMCTFLLPEKLWPKGWRTHQSAVACLRHASHLPTLESSMATKLSTNSLASTVWLLSSLFNLIPHHPFGPHEIPPSFSRFQPSLLPILWMV